MIREERWDSWMIAEVMVSLTRLSVIDFQKLSIASIRLVSNTS